MRCFECGSQAVTERPERTAQVYRRFRCRTCGKQSNERPGTVLNRAQYPSDVIALMVLWRLRYKLSLRDLPGMFAVRGIVFSHEAVRDWEAKLVWGVWCQALNVDAASFLISHPRLQQDKDSGPEVRY